MPGATRTWPLLLVILAGASALGPGAARVAAADDRQAFSELVRSAVRVMLRDVRKQIEQSYYDPSFHGVDLAANAAVALARIDKAVSASEALAAVAQFEIELDDSHTIFWPPYQTVQADYGWDMRTIGDGCYVMHVKPDSDAARQGLAPGDRITAINGLQPTRQSLWRLHYLWETLRPQPGLHLDVVTPAGTVRELDLAAKLRRLPTVMDLTTDFFTYEAHEQDEYDKWWQEQSPRMVEVGDGKVLVLRLPTFEIDNSRIQQLLKRVHGHEVLILDLRGNGGGSHEALLSLLGGFYASDLPLGSWRKRGELTPVTAQGTGKQAFGGRLFVLVDSASASASELFARVIQLSERGTVIGDRSAGAVMVSRFYPLEATHGENVIAYATQVAIADFIMTDGGRLEKAGVEPDFQVLPTAQDLAADRDPALAQALKFAGVALDSAAAGALLPQPAGR